MYRIHIYRDWSYGVNESAASDQSINTSVRDAVVASFLALARAGEASLTADREIFEEVPALAAYFAEQPVKMFTPQPAAAKPYAVTIDENYTLQFGGAENGKINIPTGQRSTVLLVLARLHTSGGIGLSVHGDVSRWHAITLEGIPTYTPPATHQPDPLWDKHRYFPLATGEVIKKGDQRFVDGVWVEAGSAVEAHATVSTLQWRRPVGSNFYTYLRLTKAGHEHLYIGTFGDCTTTSKTSLGCRHLLMETGEGMVTLTERNGKVFYDGHWRDDYAFTTTKPYAAQPFDPSKANPQP